MINLIAEIGQNHNGDIEIAKKLIDIASFSGFQYVKFQKRNPDLCVPEGKKNEIRYTPWGTMLYLDYRKKLEFGFDDYVKIAEYCSSKDIGWFASVWDIDSAEFMRPFNGTVKIPSALLTDLELLEYCRNNFMFRLLSTGMSTEKEIKEAVEILQPNVIFHTISDYPCKPGDLKLEYIKHLKEKYPGKEIGYSSHEFGLATSFATVSLGVDWIERHITLDHNMWGSDHRSSVDPVGMIKFVRGVRDIESALTGNKDREVFNCEKKKRKDLRK